MKFKTPRDCAAVSHGGVVLPVDGDGSIEADDSAASLLAAHGIAPWPEEERPRELAVITPAAIRRMSRSNLIAALEHAGYSGALPGTLAELRRTLCAAVTDQNGT